MTRPRCFAAILAIGLVLPSTMWTAYAAPRELPAPLPTGLTGLQLGGAGPSASPLLPASLDTDGDGWMDAVESELGSDPASASSTPESLAVPESCMDTVDDDGDGKVDEADQGCRPPKLSRKTFPGAGTDAFSSSMSLDDYDLPTPLGVCPLDFEGEGPAVVLRGDPTDIGGGLREVDTEIVAMQLVGTGTLAPGSPCNAGTSASSFPATIVEDPAKASAGTMTDTNTDPGADFPADSFFDVFFLVDTPLGLLPGGPPGGTPGAAVNVTNTVRSVPPYYSPGNPNLNPNCYTVAGLPHEHCPKPPLDHFKCYTGVFSAFEGEATLKDQFGQEQVGLNRPNRFCNPVSKNGQGIFDEGGHLMRYATSPPAGAPAFASINVMVQNQFGLQDLVIVGRKGLFVPTRKDKLKAPAALDHFKCYSVQGDAVGAKVRLEDQFDEADGRVERARVLEPVTLCAPVEKTYQGVTTPIGDPTMHLVCYTIETGPFARRTVRFRNQLGKGPVTVRRPVELCAPSLKTVVPGIEVDVFPSVTAQLHLQTPLGSDLVNLTGSATIEAQLGELADTDGDGLEQVPIEITQLDLQGTSQALGAMTLRLRPDTADPNQPSAGEIEESQNATPGVLDIPPFTPTGQAQSFFDVFFEIQGTFNNAPVKLHNQQPEVLTAIITFKPCGPGEPYQGQDILGLFDEQGQQSQIQAGPMVVIPNPG